MKNLLNPQTQELAKSLIESVKKQDLIDFICSCDSSFTTGTAESFLEHLKNREATQETFYKTDYTEFVLAFISYSMSEHGYDFEKVATQKMEYFKSAKMSKAKEDAKKWRENTRRAKFVKLMTDFYLGHITEEEATKTLLGRNAPDSRYAKNDLSFKTLNKVKGKLQTKSHNLKKILELVNADAERGYGDRMQLTDEEQNRAEKIEKSHGFVTRW